VDSERRVGAPALVLMSALAAALVAGLVVGLQPDAAVAGALGIGAIVGIVSIAAVDRAPGSAATDASADRSTTLVSLLTLELERGRRHEHPLSVVRVPVGDDRLDLDALRGQLRTIDSAVADGDSVYLVLPGADAAAAEGCIERLATTMPGSFVARTARHASFPDDGVTIAGLLAVLRGAPPAASPADLPSLERRRRVVVDLTAVTTPTTAPTSSLDEVGA
jgi:hypothetical protein